MNYGEELAYWYFRFNGFFPILNFVRHASYANRYPSDCDVIAIRHPFVSEDIGGQPDDWDENLQGFLNFDCIIGVICEVKTGEFDTIFPQANLISGVSRFGFFQDSSAMAAALGTEPQIRCENYQIAKILIADVQEWNSSDCHFLSLRSIRDFIKGRIRKYQQEKFAQRLFFNSVLLQQIIWEIKSEKFPI